MQRSPRCAGGLPKSPLSRGASILSRGASMCCQSPTLCLVKSPTPQQRAIGPPAARDIARSVVPAREASPVSWPSCWWPARRWSPRRSRPLPSGSGPGKRSATERSRPARGLPQGHTAAQPAGRHDTGSGQTVTRLRVGTRQTKSPAAELPDRPLYQLPPGPPLLRAAKSAPT
jgi:hypothetical protein